MNVTFRTPPQPTERTPSRSPTPVRPPRAPPNSLRAVLRQHLPLLLACVFLSIGCAFALAANTQPMVG